MDEALIDLQTRFAHQQDELDRLSDELLAQQRDIELLRGAVVELQHQLHQQREQLSGIELPEPPPPHY